MIKQTPARRPIAIANWKMYLGPSESSAAARTLRVLLQKIAGKTADVVLCPAFPALPAVRELLRGSRLLLGAQDVHHETSGPATGDVPVSHLKPFVRHVIVGHSERRRFHGETDTLVAGKARQALRAGIAPIVCVGETAEERAQGKTTTKVREQVTAVVHGLSGLSLARSVFAYEPIWAISQGIGQPSPQPDPTEAAEIMGVIRKVVSEAVGRTYAERVRVVYGGSVDAETVRPFVAEPGVDGVLVGAASTKPSAFAQIVREVAHAA